MIFSSLPACNVDAYGPSHRVGFPTNQVADRSREQALMNISLACRSFYDLVRPCLYHTIDPSGTRGRVSRFMALVIDKPDIAKLVREIRFDQGWGLDEELPLGIENAYTPRAKAITSAVQDTSLERAFSYFPQGFEDAEVAVLLMRCPGIEVLRFVASHDFDDSLLHSVFEKARAHQANLETQSKGHDADDWLSNLYEVQVCHWDTGEATDVSGLCQILQLPTLRALRGHQVSLDRGLDLNFRQNTTHLTSVHLERSIICGPGLVALLKACPKLETLQIHLGDSRVGYDQVSFAEVGNALRDFGRRLRVVGLNRDEEEDLDDDDPVMIGDLTCLQLRVLEIPVEALLLIDYDMNDESLDDGFAEEVDSSTSSVAHLLPRTIEKLKLQNCNRDDSVVEENMDAVIASIMTDENYTKLAEIRLDRRPKLADDAKALGWRFGRSQGDVILHKSSASAGVSK